MSGNNGMDVRGAIGAEGGTLNTGEPTQPNQAAPGRFPKTACHKLANGVSASAGAEDGRGGSSVQCERNGTGVQCPDCGGQLGTDECDPRRCRLPGGIAALVPADGSDTNADLNADVCEGLAGAVLDGGKRSRARDWLALDAARSWARDWLDVYGQPSALWELLLRFAALVAMRPGERRRLDEAHTVRLFEAEPGALLEVGQLTAGIVLPFGAERFGRALPEGEVGELEALVRGAIQRVEVLQAEAELFRHAAGLIRNNEAGARGGWHPGFCDFLNEWGTTLDAPHPDAVSFSLFGALAQAWAERGGGGQVPVAYLVRLAELACGLRKPSFVPSREVVVDLLRALNHDPSFSRDRALNALIGAALAADAEAESEVL